MNFGTMVRLLSFDLKVMDSSPEKIASLLASGKAVYIHSPQTP